MDIKSVIEVARNNKLKVALHSRLCDNLHIGKVKSCEKS